MQTTNGLRYFCSPLIDGGVAHGFLTRAGGASPAPYDSLNFDARQEDTQENVAENRGRFMAAFGAHRLLTVRQVHGSSVLLARGPDEAQAVEADAIITSLEGVAIGVLTADCLPLLLYDPASAAVAAVHAGWKGTALGVAMNAVREMGRAFGTKPANLRAALGPFIGPCCYSVGQSVYEEFKGLGRDLDCFIRLEDGLRLDIGAENVSQLLSLGVRESNISGAAPCTSCSAANFFSYRRDGVKTGRQLSFIMLREARPCS